MADDKSKRDFRDRNQVSADEDYGGPVLRGGGWDYARTGQGFDSQARQQPGDAGARSEGA